MSNIAKRPNGKYRARYRDEAGKEHARHFDRKIDAQTWLNEVTATVVTGMYVDPGAGRLTFDAYFREWASRQVWVEGTEIAADLTRRSVTFGTVPLAKLRASHIESWVKQSAVRLAPNTVRARLNTVQACLKAAIRDRRIAVDPSVGIKVPRARRAEAAMVIPTVEEIGAMLEACDQYRRPLILLTAFGGLRLGEACAVKITDINFLRRELRVQRQVQRKSGGGLWERAPKYGSERTVHLPDGVVAELAKHIETFGFPSEGWLMISDNGPIGPSTANSWWLGIRKAAGLRPIRMHDLRHFYASGLIAAGCDVVTVQRALGHSNASTTLNTYSHLWPKAEDRTRKAAAELFAQSVAPPTPVAPAPSAAPADSVRTGKIV